MKAIFSSDLHGNFNQYRLLFKKATDENIDIVIIGGDITPKGVDGSIEGQKYFLENELFPLFKKQKSKILMVLGNDDWASSVDVIEKFDSKFFFHMNNKKIKINNINFVGYSYVPITPFGIKDWEKWDAEDQPLERIRLNGYKSKNNNIVNFSFNKNNKKDNIENDLKKIKKLSDPKTTIYIFHSPPFNTKLDMTARGIHVGSRAIRKFIEENQPLLTLHGHIHETVDVSGSFIEKIGKTICVTAGNHNDGDELAVVVFDINNLSKIERKIIK